MASNTAAIPTAVSSGNMTLFKALFLRFLKFGVVGVSGTVIDFGLTWVLKEKCGVKKFVANTIGFVVAASSNYVLNRIWTWGSHSTHVATEYFKFFGVSVIGLGINTLILYLLNEKAHWNFWVSKVCATAVVMVWNFITRKMFLERGGAADASRKGKPE